MPTLHKTNAVARDTPEFILHLYDRALLNAAALRALGITKDTPNPPGGVIYKNQSSQPSGLLLAETIRPASIERIKALGDGIGTQHYTFRRTIF